MTTHAKGLQEQDYVTVLQAFDRMSVANESQRQAWRIIERADHP